MFHSEMRRVPLEVVLGLEGLSLSEEAMPFSRGSIFAEKPMDVEEEGSPEPNQSVTQFNGGSSSRMAAEGGVQGPQPPII